MYDLYKEDIKSYQLFISTLSNIIITRDDVIVCCCHASYWQGLTWSSWGSSLRRLAWLCTVTQNWQMWENSSMTWESPGPRGITGHCVVSEEEMLWRHSSQWTGETVRERERETGLSKSQLPHSSHAQQAGSSVSQETPHWSSFVNTGPLLARRECHCQATWVYDSMIWPS